MIISVSHLDPAFLPNSALHEAVTLLNQALAEPEALPLLCPETGIGELATLQQLAPHVLGGGARLDAPQVLAHMDPPTPWITWAMALWNARLNQNLLHPSTAPFALEAEHRVLAWLTPFFAMNGGHFCSGSTLANLTALWAARDACGVTEVIASEAAHFSIPKAAKILGLPYGAIPTNAKGELEVNHLTPDRLRNACLVLTAGTTATGAIDPLEWAGLAKWTHVDAAWAGPLRLSPRYAGLLQGIEKADSLNLSAHKWFFQPKESAIVLFRQPELAQEALSFGGSYLATANVGLQGSRGAAAIPLLATLLAWGRQGMAERIEATMAMADQLAAALAQDDRFVLWGEPKTGITVFRPRYVSTEELYRHLPTGMLSTCVVDQHTWLRSVAINPLADVAQILATLETIEGGLPT
jgi:L-2,4-diaminobutyrate decarboxylase